MNPTQPYTILVVDDDRDIRELLSSLLRKNAYNTLLASNAVDMVKHVESRTAIHLIILDVMMPGEDGLSLLKRLPSIISPPPPVLILSARGEEIDRIIGLEMGSDDYLVKPFHPRELLARVKSILRRHQPISESHSHNLDIVHFGKWLFDRTRRILFKVPSNTERKDWATWIKNESGEGLNTIEYRLLRVLTDHPQRVLSRDFLLDTTIGRKHIPTDRTIDVQMSRLRNRLDDNAREPSLIRTVRYEGYMLSSPVEKI